MPLKSIPGTPQGSLEGGVKEFVRHLVPYSHVIFAMTSSPGDRLQVGRVYRKWSTGSRSEEFSGSLWNRTKRSH